ncbi:MAG: FAD-dependent monooxygenase [Alphaproteobacteria bacterium]
MRLQPQPNHLTGSRFAVVGAGISGLAAAIALARAGAQVDVFEQATGAREFGAGLQLGPNAMRVLDRLGVNGALTQFAHRPARITVASATSGHEIAAMQLGQKFEARYGAPYCTFARPDLHAALTQAAIAHGARLHYGAKAGSFSQTDSQIALEFDTHPRWQGAGIIGADGLWSNLRGHLSPAQHQFTGHVAWRATLPLGQAPPGISQTDIGLLLAAQVHIVHYPIHDKLLNLVVVVEGTSTGTGWHQTGDRDALLARLGSLAKPVVALVERAQDLCRWPLFATVPGRTTGTGRLTLMGDAAHPMLPYLAAGAAMGIEDAWVLAQALTATGDVALAMREYERARAARIERVQNEARKNAKRFHLSGARAQLRDLGLRAAGQIAPGFLGARLGWLYGGGPV